MPRRPKSDTAALAAKLSATEQHIRTNLDNTDWDDLLRSHDYCRSCPSRTGPEIIHDKGMINDYCMSCPLRQWLLVTCELAMRQRRSKASAASSSNAAPSSGAEGGK